MLPDPLAAVPFKVSRTETDAGRRKWLESHGWPITIGPMTLNSAKFWDAKVRPTIQRLELERRTGIKPNLQPRADAYWKIRWPTIWRVFSSIQHIPSGPGLLSLHMTNSQLWEINSSTNTGAVVPIGLLLGLSKFELPGTSPTEARHFTWLLTSAPDDFLVTVGLPTGLALGRALLDTVIQVSLTARCGGRVLLHADPNGGDGLLRFYEAAMMQYLPTKTYPKVSAIRQNDGRYFVFDEARAGAYSLALSNFRTSALGPTASNFGAVKVKPEA